MGNDEATKPADEEIETEDERQDDDRDLFWEEGDPADRRKDPLRAP